MAQRSSGRQVHVHDAATARELRRILAVDYGRKTIGLALSDELGITAQPFGTLERRNRKSVIQRIRQVCRAHGVARIIVGHPVHMTGEAGAMAEEAARFASRLKKEIGIEVQLHDERLTSWEAGQTMADTGAPSRRRLGRLDDVAAAILLRDYLEHVHSFADLPSAAVDKD
jgi:putative Holliday junction resolvase